MQRRAHMPSQVKLGSNQKEPTRQDDPNKYKYWFTRQGNEIYVSKKKGKSFAWVRYPQELTNYFKIKKFIYGDDFKILYDYKDFLKKFQKLKKLLKANDMYAIYLDNQGQWSLDGTHWVDYQWEDVKEYLKKREGIDFTTDYKTIIYLDDVELLWAASKIKKGKLEVSYTLRKEDKVLFYELITQVFGKDVTLPKAFSQKIVFKLKKFD